MSAAGWHTVGLRSDGHVVTTGWNRYGQRNTSDWADIITVSAGEFQTVGLRSNGTAVASGNDYYDQCNISDWENIRTP